MNTIKILLNFFPTSILLSGQIFSGNMKITRQKNKLNTFIYGCAYFGRGIEQNANKCNRIADFDASERNVSVRPSINELRRRPYVNHNY